MIKFEFVVEGPPVSQQARRRERLKEWQSRVRQAAEKHWPSDQQIATESVMLQITYFYDTLTVDVDNIIKPIQDAIIGLAYVDDEQVTDVIARKRFLFNDFRIEDISTILAAGFSFNCEFLHIVVVDAPNQEEIAIWPLHLQT